MSCQAILLDYLPDATHTIAHECDNPDQSHRDAHVCAECGKRWQAWNSEEEDYQEVETSLCSEKYIDESHDNDHWDQEEAYWWSDSPNHDER